jgi:hypothetical protein
MSNSDNQEVAQIEIDEEKLEELGLLNFHAGDEIPLTEVLSRQGIEFQEVNKLSTDKGERTIHVYEIVMPDSGDTQWVAEWCDQLGLNSPPSFVRLFFDHTPSQSDVSEAIELINQASSN